MDPERVRDLAREVGLPTIGFAPAEPIARHEAFVAWLDAGYAADMTWLARDAEPRRDPRALLAEARTVIVAALSYAHPDGADENARIPVERLTQGPRGTIARYARGGDYHNVLKNRLRKLGDAIERELARPVARLVCVDTAPLLERELAGRAGLGFLAKSAMLIAPGQGSYLSLGALLVDFACATGTPMPQRCGSCTACLVACPTGAFVGPYVIDARRCISYLTIENRGAIPRELRSAIGTRIFGCDVCQEVCPFNATERAGDPELAPRGGFSHPPLVHLMQLGAAQFRKWQQRSALRRIHRPELLRNVAVALGNAGGEESIPVLREALKEPSPLVRAHVVWALAELGRRGFATDAILRAHVDDDPDVCDELARALGALPA